MPSDALDTLLKRTIPFAGDVAFLPYGNLSADDQERVLVWRNHDTIRRWMLNSQPIALEQHKSFCQSLVTRRDRYYWAVQSKGELIGTVNLTEIDDEHRRACWGYFVDPVRLGQGKGLLIEYFLLELVFKTIQLHCLRAQVHVDNVETLRVQEFFGFREEGRLREYLWNADSKSFVDLAVLSLLAKEWENHQATVRPFIAKLLRIPL